MAKWEVVREKVEVMAHPNADSLSIGKVGQWQVVFQTGLYQSGDEVLFIPEKSVLPDSIAEPFRNYLKGPERNRVGSVRLRGELSMGICMSIADAGALCGTLPDSDIASALGIEKHEPPIPASLSGEMFNSDELWSQHDVEQFAIYSGEFEPDEEIVVHEKVHGTQVMYGMNVAREMFASSKGVLSRGRCLIESEANTYWQAAANCGIRELLLKLLESALADKERVFTVQLFGEVVPVQGANWTYGVNPGKPEARLFDARVDGASDLSWCVVPGFSGLWVPEVASGKAKNIIPQLPDLCRGNELVSGKSLHIREGVVVRPLRDRRACDGTRLMVKVINPAYSKRETGEELS